MFKEERYHLHKLFQCFDCTTVTAFHPLVPIRAVPSCFGSRRDATWNLDSWKMDLHA